MLVVLPFLLLKLQLLFVVAANIKSLHASPGPTASVRRTASRRITTTQQQIQQQQVQQFHASTAAGTNTSVSPANTADCDMNVNNSYIMHNKYHGVFSLLSLMPSSRRSTTGADGGST